MDNIFIIIEKIGDLLSIVDKAYYYFGEAKKNCDILQNEAIEKGYTDFKYYVQSLEIIGLK